MELLHPLYVAQVGGGQTQAPTQEPGATLLDMASFEGHLHPRKGNLDRLHVFQKRQLKAGCGSARPCHLQPPLTEQKMMVAVRAAFLCDGLTQCSVVLDVLAGADDEERTGFL